MANPSSTASQIKRRQKKSRSGSPTCTEQTETGTRAQPHNGTISFIAPPLSPFMASRRLFVASLGNPPPKYHLTRHSAGHVLLKALASRLSYPPLQRSKVLGAQATQANDLPSTYTLWQSPSLMNISGVALLKAYRAWLADNGARMTDSGQEFGLVVLHDELEAPLGNLKVRRGGKEASARGHKGIRSAVSSLEGAGMLKDVATHPSCLVRIGVGIGRPVSREKDDVADYVLGQMTEKERMKIESAAEPLISLLEREVNG